MIAQAAKITAGATAAGEKADLIFEWVRDNLKKDVAVTLPSALDVLKTMRGDCNEHTVLFTALARAAGIPSKMLSGLVYRDGSFLYHAWPAVWLGAWVELDPTWGQRRVDATHLPLVEGELSGQVRLVRVMGRLRIGVIEEGESAK
jgi:transglutaminase-like putative cysteine protease